MGLGEILGGSLGLLADPFMWVLLIVGALYGIVAGAMPGIGQTMAYGLILPFTFALAAHHGVALLLATAVGVQYGNSLPAVLIGLPGTPGAVLTAVDGFALYKRGERGVALATQYIAALGGQFVSIGFFILAVIPLSGLAFIFLPPELFGLYLLGLVAIVSLTGQSVLRGIAAAALGMFVGLIGLDPITNLPRYAPDPSFRTGLDETALVIGLLAVGELFRQMRQVYQYDADIAGQSVPSFPPLSQLRRIWRPAAIGTVVGTFVGAIPGAGGGGAALLSYQQAKIFSKNPEEFGKGSIEGLAAHEAAQSASNSGEIIPTLGLGIPTSGSTVLLLTALMLQGIVPGPQMIRQTPDLLSAAILGLTGATIVLAIVGWKAAMLMVRVISFDRQVVNVVALTLVVVGVYAIRGRVFDVLVCLGAGIVGYFMLRHGYSTAAAALAVIVSPRLESSLRTGLRMTDYDLVQFLSRPITLVLVVLAGLLLVYGAVAEYRTRRRQAATMDAGAHDLSADRTTKP